MTPDPDLNGKTPTPDSSLDTTGEIQGASEEPDKPAASTPQKKAKGRSLLLYVIAMFSVALLLLFLSFFMQQRNHTVLMEGLSSSKVDAQTLQSLELENATLEERLDQAESQLSQQNSPEKASTAQDARASEWLLTMWFHYQNGDMAAAVNLLKEFQELGLSDHLSAAPPVPGTPSPLELYQKLNQLLLSQ